MFLSPRSTLRAFSLSRAPWHSGHVRSAYSSMPSSSASSSSSTFFAAHQVLGGLDRPPALARVAHHHALLFDLLEVEGAESVAGRARAARVVEAEQARLEVGHRVPALGATAVDRKGVRGLAVRILDLDQTVGERQRKIHALFQAHQEFRIDDQAVDQEIDVVALVARKLDRVFEFDPLPVDPRAAESFFGPALELGQPLALLTADHGGEDLKLLALLFGHHRVDDLLRGLTLEGLVVGRAMRHADAGVEQTQVIVDLGHRPHRRARVGADRLLIDRDRGRKSLDRIDVGLFQLFDELAGVGAQGFDEAPLPLGEDGVEGQRGFAAAAETRDHRDLVPRDEGVYIFKIVLARTFDNDSVFALDQHATP